MDEIVLRNEKVQATFAPKKGMNLLQLKKEEIEVIDLKTKPLFEERFAGLGSLIGPHFHHRPLNKIPEVPSEELFSHIARVKAKGVLEPFSHGIARYAPWTCEASKTSLKATLSGVDIWNGVSLATLEGFFFTMQFEASLLPNGISLDLSVEADEPSLVGLHYYYALPLGGGKIKSSVEPQFRTNEGWKPIPLSFLDQKGDLSFDVEQEADFGFIPKKGKDGFEILYENTEYSLRLTFQVESEDVSFQIYRPKESSYICIEPLTAKNPKAPSSKKSRLQVRLEIL